MSTLHECLHQPLDPKAILRVEVRDYAKNPICLNAPDGLYPLTVKEAKSLICELYLAINSLESKNEQTSN